MKRSRRWPLMALASCFLGPSLLSAQGPGGDSQAIIDPAGFGLSFDAPAGKGASSDKVLREIARDPLFSHDVLKVRKALESGSKADTVLGFGLTPLHLAALRGNTTAIGVLLEHGATVNVGLSMGNADAKWTFVGLSKKQVKEVPTATGLTPLHLAAAFGHDQSVALLCRRGADVNAGTIFRQTPLKFALMIAGSQKTIQTLVFRGADLATRDAQGESPFMIAAMVGDIRIVRLALQTGAAVDMASKEGLTALHFAADKGHLDIVKFLLDSKADPGLREAQGRTAYDLAVASGHKEVAELLKTKPSR